MATGESQSTSPGHVSLLVWLVHVTWKLPGQPKGVVTWASFSRELCSSSSSQRDSMTWGNYAGVRRPCGEAILWNNDQCSDLDLMEAALDGISWKFSYCDGGWNGCNSLKPFTLVSAIYFLLRFKLGNGDVDDVQLKRKWNFGVLFPFFLIPFDCLTFITDFCLSFIISSSTYK